MCDQYFDIDECVVKCLFGNIVEQVRMFTVLSLNHIKGLGALQDHLVMSRNQVDIANVPI